MKYDKISKEEVEEVIKDILYGKENDTDTKPRVPSIKHYEWEEDGEKFSSWKIDTGDMILNCGDNGMELFEKALKDILLNDKQIDIREPGV